jgi:putative methyltransferase (TIGR04325 family)
MDRKIIHEYIPPVITRFLTGLFYGWHGNYRSWKAATAKCDGYDSSIIFEKVRESALKVKSGDAVYERDSFLFNEIQYSYPLLASLMWISAVNNGKLHVLDFGGSLGSTYFQNKKFLDTLPDVQWCVVEQPQFVKEGRQNFENKNLLFYFNIEECLGKHDIDIVLFSSVLQYLEKPYEIVDEIISRQIDYILIDRTPFIKGKDRLTIQTVNPRIYRAKYPCWYFNKSDLLSRLNKSYNLVLEFEALDKSNIESEFMGFLFRRSDI